jgi:predicted DCC family thiol-disulfide oxidoreductase YuxK
MLTRRGFDLAPLQTPWVAECFDLALPERPKEMLLLSADGRIFGGMDAILFIARSVWWAWPLYVMGKVPIVRRVLSKGYRWLAAHRMCFGGECPIHAHHH